MELMIFPLLVSCQPNTSDSLTSDTPLPIGVNRIIPFPKPFAGLSLKINRHEMDYP